MEQIMLVINKPLAQLSGVLGILVSVIYILKRIGFRYPKDHWCNKLDRRLRQIHKPLGICLTGVATLHTICSFAYVFNCLWGIICLVAIFLLGASYMLRKRTKRWMMLHRIVTLIFIIAMVLHIGEVR